VKVDRRLMKVGELYRIRKFEEEYLVGIYLGAADAADEVSQTVE